MAAPDDIRALLDKGANTEARNEHGLTPLHHAAAKGTPANIATLLDKGADIEARDWYGYTPLHHAAQFGTPTNIAALLDHGADIEVQDKNGSTPPAPCRPAWHPPPTSPPCWTATRT